jgi:hypothetical protein
MGKVLKKNFIVPYLGIVCVCVNFVWLFMKILKKIQKFMLVLALMFLAIFL